jgi:hypothetical protein
MARSEWPTDVAYERQSSLNLNGRAQRRRRAGHRHRENELRGRSRAHSPKAETGRSILPLKRTPSRVSTLVCLATSVPRKDAAPRTSSCPRTGTSPIPTATGRARMAKSQTRSRWHVASHHSRLRLTRWIDQAASQWPPGRECDRDAGRVQDPVTSNPTIVMHLLDSESARLVTFLSSKRCRF